MSMDEGGKPIVSSGLISLIVTGGLIIVGLLVASRFVGSIGNVFGSSENDSQGGQQSDSTAEIGRLNAELSRATTEAGRLDEEANRADKEGRRADAEELRAQAEQERARAELLRAQNDKLAIELADKAGTLKTDVVIGEDSDQSKREEVSQQTESEAKENVSDETPSGQKITKEEPETIVKGSQPDVELNVGRDEIEEAVEKASNKTRGQNRFNKNRQSFFDEGSTEQIFVEGDAPVTITGGGSTDKKTTFTLQEKRPMTLSDVIRQNPTFSASQARDFLSKSGVFESEVQKKKFEEFDFGTNTGTAQKVPTVNRAGDAGESIPRNLLNQRTRVSEEALRIEREKAEETLKRITSGQTLIAPKPKPQKRSFR